MGQVRLRIEACSTGPIKTRGRQVAGEGLEGVVVGEQEAPVHVEVVHNMSADALINAITRFSARRPGSHHFISDRGTNLTAADKILKKDTLKF